MENVSLFFTTLVVTMVLFFILAIPVSLVHEIGHMGMARFLQPDCIITLTIEPENLFQITLDPHPVGLTIAKCTFIKSEKLLIGFFGPFIEIMLFLILIVFDRTRYIGLVIASKGVFSPIIEIYSGFPVNIITSVVIAILLFYTAVYLYKRLLFSQSK